MIENIQHPLRPFSIICEGRYSLGYSRLCGTTSPLPHFNSAFCIESQVGRILLSAPSSSQLLGIELGDALFQGTSGWFETGQVLSYLVEQRRLLMGNRAYACFFEMFTFPR